MAELPELQAMSGRLERGEIDSAQYIDQLMRFVAKRVGCSRAALRLFADADHGRTLRCSAMFDSTLDRMVSAADILHRTDSRYIAQLQNDGIVIVTRSPDDPVASDVLDGYMRASHVTAMMDVSFSANGAVFGTFSCEQLGPPIDWTARQLQLLRKVASRASLTLMHMLSMSLDTAPGALWETSTPNRLATMPMPLDPTKS
jgi:hypothetical protein